MTEASRRFIVGFVCSLCAVYIISVVLAHFTLDFISSPDRILIFQLENETTVHLQQYALKVLQHNETILDWSASMGESLRRCLDGNLHTDMVVTNNQQCAFTCVAYPLFVCMDTAMNITYAVNAWGNFTFSVCDVKTLISIATIKR